MLPRRVPSSDKPFFQGDGGYEYDVGNDKTITIAKSPHSAGGQKLKPGAAAYAAIANELNDKYQLDLPTDVAAAPQGSPSAGSKPVASARGYTIPDMVGAPPVEAPNARAHVAPASSAGKLPTQTSFGGMADRERNDPPTRMDNAATTAAKAAALELPREVPLITGLQPNTGTKAVADVVRQSVANPAKIEGAMTGAAPLSADLGAALVKQGYPNGTPSAITPDVVKWLDSQPDAALYKPSESPRNALEMIRAMASSPTSMASSNYGQKTANARPF